MNSTFSMEAYVFERGYFHEGDITVWDDVMIVQIYISYRSCSARATCT